MSLPCIIAHRCGGALAPENSLAGLLIAARMGCRGVEFDVMLTADGVPVLMHDETLERTTDRQGRLADLSLAELSNVDAGCRHHPAFAVSPVPTFRSALALCADLGLWANVEIKPATGHEAATGRVVADQLAASPMAGTAMLSSFSPAALAAAVSAQPALPRALLVEHVPANWSEAVHQAGATAIHCAARHLSPVTAAAIARAGLRLACYTVNRREEADALFAAGVSALFTDRPDLWQPTEM